MALVTESFNGDGVSETFTVSNEVLSKSHVRVHYYYDLVDHEVTDDDWDLLGKGTVVFVDAPSNGYIVKITTSTDGTGLGTLPSDLNTLTALTPDISIVADNASSVATVASDLSGVDNIGTVVDSLPLLNAVNNNKVNVDKVATDIVNVNTVAENISPVVAAASNIGAVVGLYDNYSDIVNASANVDTGLTNVINITPNTVGVSTTISSGNDAASFGTINIPYGVEVTIENDAAWLIIG